MIDAWIVEKIVKKEKIKDDRPQIQLPLPEDYPLREIPKETESNRGVFKIDIGECDEDDDEDEDQKTKK